ncbi:hypothetical protein BDW71DRAFT_100885 [Aspergillus fruticulosus]
MMRIGIPWASLAPALSPPCQLPSHIVGSGSSQKKKYHGEFLRQPLLYILERAGTLEIVQQRTTFRTMRPVIADVRHFTENQPVFEAKSAYCSHISLALVSGSPS